MYHCCFQTNFHTADTRIHFHDDARPKQKATTVLTLRWPRWMHGLVVLVRPLEKEWEELLKPNRGTGVLVVVVVSRQNRVQENQKDECLDQRRPAAPMIDELDSGFHGKRLASNTHSVSVQFVVEALEYNDALDNSVRTRPNLGRKKDPK
jgi:hypothetical protein